MPPVIPIITAVASVALGVIASVIAPEPKAISAPAPTPITPPPEQRRRPRSRTVTYRQAAVTRKLPFGEVVLSGPITFYEAQNGNSRHHMIVTLGDAPDAPWDSMPIVWLDDTPVFESDLSGTKVVSGKFANNVRIHKGLGGPDQQAKPFVVNNIGRLDSNFRGRGVAYIYVRFDWDPDLFPNGLPNVRVLARTNAPLDTRDQTRRYNPNAALALHEYCRLDQRPGLAFEAADVETAATDAAANICDEMVDARPVGHIVWKVTTSNDRLSLAVKERGAPIRLQTGDRLELAAAPGGSLPSPIAPETDYYAIVDRLVGRDEGGLTTLSVDPADFPDPPFADAIAAGAIDDRKQATLSPVVRLASTYDEALSGDAINLTSTGSGRILVVKTGEPRYTVSVVLDASEEPVNNIRQMLSAMGGHLVWSGASFRIVAGAYTSPVLSFDERDLMGPLQVRSRHSRRERYNAVQGLFRTHLTLGEETDYPSVIDSAYVAADGGRRIFADLDLPATSRPSTAVRLAKRALAAHRREKTVDFPTTQKGLRVLPAETVSVSNARRGWVNKPFLVDEVQDIEIAASDEGLPFRGARLSLVETDSTVDDFDPLSDETVKPPEIIPPGGNPLDGPPPPSAVEVVSSVATAGTRYDGSLFARIYVAWLPPADAFVTSGGHVEIQIRETGGTYRVVQTLPGSASETYIGDVEEGQAYDIRLVAINQLGVRSSPAETLGHVVGGPADPLPDITDFRISILDDVATLSWNQVVAASLDYYELRFSPLTAGVVWGQMAPLLEQVTGASVQVPAMTGTYAIKAVGFAVANAPRPTSLNAAYIVTAAGALSALNAVEQVQEDPAFAGPKDDVYLDPILGGLRLADVTDVFSHADVFAEDDIFDTGNIEMDGIYTFGGAVSLGDTYTSRVSLLIEAGGVNLISDIFVQPDIFDLSDVFFSDLASWSVVGELRVKESPSDPFGAWERLIMGDVRASDYEARLLLSSDEFGLTPIVQQARLQVDMPDRVIAAEDIAVPAVGSSISFDPAFRSLQGVAISAQDLDAGDYYEITNKGPGGFDIAFKDDAGQGVARTFDYVAKGYGRIES